MSKSPVTLTALAAFAANLVVLFTAFDGIAEEPAQLRRVPAQLAPAQVRPVKPSRPQSLQLRREAKSTGPIGIVIFPSAGSPGGADPNDKPDLVVVPYYDNDWGLPEGFPTHSYCMKNPAGGTPTHIRFYIRNLGGAASGGFQWTPSFPNAGAAPAYVLPSIQPGGQVTITQPIPNGCYDGNYSAVCQFSIHLDDHHEVEELGESNTYESYCVSPAG